MAQIHNNFQEESDIKRIIKLLLKNYKLFIISVFCTGLIAFLINRYSNPLYNISSSLLIKEDVNQQSPSDANNFINSNLFGISKNLQNELWVMKSYPVIEKTVRNLDLTITYFSKGRIQSVDAYKSVPFKVTYLPDHPQPLNIDFLIEFKSGNKFELKADSKIADFYNYATGEVTHHKRKWEFKRTGTLGELVETPDLAFMVEPLDSTIVTSKLAGSSYKFEFTTVESLRDKIKGSLNFKVVDKMATVIEINLSSESEKKGVDIVNELMYVYSDQSLEQKNHIASITIDYIEKQLSEISDSLNQTEDNLQSFRSSNQLLNITDQASGISVQYRDLQNQLAELVSRKRYYDYVSDLLKNDSFSNMMLPAAMGISDQLLNNLMSELIAAQAQRSNLIENNQERNPLVQRLGIQIENLKKTISENILAVGKTTSISIEEMSKRVKKIESEISRLPITQRKLGNIERKYRLNDAIYNYLMEKHAEAKITKASNLPNDIIIEPALVRGQISPNHNLNYLISLFLGLVLPFGFLIVRNLVNNKIENQDDIERITEKPVLGKILHNRYKIRNVMHEFPKSTIAESFRALRTNLDFYLRGGPSKVIMVTSCLEHEGKSFVAANLAMSYAQLGKMTILLDFDLRKPSNFFSDTDELQEGLSSYMINKTNLEDIILKSPNEKLHYIPSGILPPNPVELIALEKTEILINALKKDYEIIILDTTPLAQVTDGYLLINLSEIKILVSRSNFSLKNVLSVVINDLNQKNVNNVCIVLNDNRIFRDQYGYGYGYYEDNKKSKRKKEKIKTPEISLKKT